KSLEVDERGERKRRLVLGLFFTASFKRHRSTKQQFCSTPLVPLSVCAWQHCHGVCVMRPLSNLLYDLIESIVLYSVRERERERESMSRFDTGNCFGPTHR